MPKLRAASIMAASQYEIPKRRWAASHAIERKVRVSLQHENSHELAQAIAHVSNTSLQRFWLIAEHWSVEQRWTLLLTHIFRHWLGGKWLGMLPPEAESLLSG